MISPNQQLRRLPSVPMLDRHNSYYRIQLSLQRLCISWVVAVISLGASGLAIGQSDGNGPVVIVKDNSESNGVALIGSWTTGNKGTQFGSNHIHDNNSGKGTKSVTFTPELPTGEPYAVYIWYPGGTNRATNVPVDIHHADGVTTVSINQRENEGRWNFLGTFNFAAGSAGKVVVRTTGTNGRVEVDAVRFVRAMRAKVNVQPRTVPIPEGYISDEGLTFRNQNGLAYGWDISLANSPQPWADRESPHSPDQRYDTFIRMMDNDDDDNLPATWEMEVINGVYDVRVVTGDAAIINEPQEIYVEGVLASKGITSADRRWLDDTVTVEVKDGRLTLSTGRYASSGAAVPTKLCFIEIAPATLKPEVAVLDPPTGIGDYRFLAGGPVQFAINASSAAGTVAQVELFNGEVLVGTDLDGSDGWSPVWDGAPAGSYSLRVVATDSFGRKTEVTLPVRVVGEGNLPPTVQIDSPKADSITNTSSSINVPVQVAASDPDGAISRVEFFVPDPFFGEIKLGQDLSAPYSMTWTQVGPGSHYVRVRVWDDDFEVSEAIVPFVVNDLPSVTIHTPGNGRTYSVVPSTMRIGVSAVDTDGTIEKVKFYRDGHFLAEDTDGSDGWSYAPPGGFGEGLYNFRAVAIDNRGAEVQSSQSTATIIDRTHSVDSSSYLGGTGADRVRGAGIQANGTVVLAANISDAKPGGLDALLLNGATAGSAGAVVRLSADGRKVLSVTRVAVEITDMALDGAGNIYVAARSQGVIKLTPDASAVLWARPEQKAERVDVAADGTAVALRDAEEFSGSSNGTNDADVYDANGNVIGRAAGFHNRVYDVAIDGNSRTIYFTGYRQGTGPSGNPVQIAYIRATGYDGTEKWVNYNWTATQVDGNESGGTGSGNNMADTRGLRISIGRDGKLYTLFMCAGGNHIFRWAPKNIFQPVSIVGGDNFHSMSNSRAEHKTFFARYDPVTGDYLLGQHLTARLPDTRANTVWGEEGAIEADEQGRVYLGLDARVYLPYKFDPVPDAEYGAGPTFLVMSADFKQRLFMARLNSDGQMHAVAVRTHPGDENPHVVFGGMNTGPSQFLKKPIQGTRGDGTDGFFAVKRDMIVSPAAISIDNTSPSGVTVTGSWFSTSSENAVNGSYFHDNNSGKGTRAIRYTPVLPSDGLYEVFGTWNAGSDRADAVPYQLQTADGLVEGTINQQFNGKFLSFLGSFNLSAGTSTSIHLRNAGTTGRVSADSFLFVRVAPPTPRAGGAAKPFQQAEGPGGLAVLEAENHSVRTRRSGHDWVSVHPEGASAQEAMLTSPSDGFVVESTETSSSPRMDYAINFVKSGPHYLWIRGLGGPGRWSCHAGLNLEVQQSASGITGTQPQEAWFWTNALMDGQRASINVPAPGVHTLSIWMREAGFTIDKILLTTDPGFIPVDAGPSENRLARPLDVWRTRNFTSEAELGNPNRSGPLGDFDFDGILNHFEYALGLNPRVADARDLPVPRLVNRRLTLRYKRLKSASDIRYIVEFAGALTGPWSSDESDVMEEVVFEDDDMEIVEAKSTVDIGQKRRGFLRLRVEERPQSDQ